MVGWRTQLHLPSLDTLAVRFFEGKGLDESVSDFDSMRCRQHFEQDFSLDGLSDKD